MPGDTAARDTSRISECFHTHNEGFPKLRKFLAVTLDIGMFLMYPRVTSEGSDDATRVGGCATRGPQK